MTQILTLLYSITTSEFFFIIVLLSITVFVNIINNKIKSSNKKEKDEEDNGLTITVAGLTISSRLISCIILWSAFVGIVLGLPSLQVRDHFPMLLVNICNALYASSVFAILVTSFVNKKHETQFNEILNKIDVLHNQGLYRPYHIFQSNDSEKPDEVFFNELVDSILKSEHFTYEGENARNATMCLKAIQKYCKKVLKGKSITIKMILHEFDAEKLERMEKPQKEDYINDVIDLFATIYFLSEELDNDCFNLTVYKRNSISANFVNLTDEKLFFSPFDVGQEYPVTYCYVRDTSSKEESFYRHFKSSMDKRINKFRANESQKSNNDLYTYFKIKDFCKEGYFWGEKKNTVDKRFLQKVKDEILKERLKEREDRYSKCLVCIENKYSHSHNL